MDVASVTKQDLVRESAYNTGPHRNWANGPRLSSSDMTAWRNKDAFAADARDSARSNPYGKSALRSQVDSIIGTNFTLQYRPDAKALGVTPEEAADYADLVEEVWQRAATSPYNHMDAQRKQTFSSLMRSAYSSFYVSGETLATIEWKKSSNGDRTCLHLLEPERLSDPQGRQDYLGKRRMGVERDQHGAPVAYHIREVNISDAAIWGPASDQWKWKRIPRYTGWGRLNVIHYFDQDRPDMTRGLTSYITALQSMRLLQDYNLTELESAALRATYAAVIESELDYESAMMVIGDEKAGAIGSNPALDMRLRMMADQVEYYRGQDFKFGKSKVAHLLPNEKLHMVQGTQSASALKDFNSQNLQQIASSLGVDYATLTKDFSSTNYSGARAALFDVWRSYEVRRQAFIDSVPNPFFGAWLEEQIAVKGSIPMLGKKTFYEARDAICKSSFQTWSKPRLDPQKENAADQLLYDMGALSLRDICAQDGRDWRDVLQQRALEKAMRLKLGLKPEDINPDLNAPKPAATPGASSNAPGNHSPDGQTA
jgi:lambda family phage portal protein